MYVPIAMGLHPAAAVVASVLAAVLVSQAHPAVAMLRERQSQPGLGVTDPGSSQDQALPFT